MHRLVTALAVASSLSCVFTAFGADPPSDAATILAVEGNIVTIADARGRKKSVEVVDAKGLRGGSKISWCEEDCRVLRTGDRSLQVRRVLETKR